MTGPSLAPSADPQAAFVASETVIARSDTPARVKIMEPRTGTVLIINKPGTNEPMVSVNEDGTLTIGEGYTPDAAAREFWDALAQSVGAMWPYLALAKASGTAGDEHV